MGIESRLLRAAANSTQEEIAQWIGKDRTTISKILSSEMPIKLKDLDVICEKLGLVIFQKDDEVMTVSRRKYKALELLAMEAMNDADV